MKKKQHKGKGKKAFTAVGAVVAAGLSPGIIAATPGCLPGQASEGITAADAIVIDGTAYGFDELYAMQQPDTAEMNVDRPVTKVEVRNATKYGVRPSTMPPIQPATHYGGPRPKKPAAPARVAPT